MQFVVTILCYIVLCAVIALVAGFLGLWLMRLIKHQEWPFLPDNDKIGKEDFKNYHVVKIQGDEEQVKKMLGVRERFKGEFDYPRTVYAIVGSNGKNIKLDIGRNYIDRTQKELYDFINKNKIKYFSGLIDCDMYRVNYMVAYETESGAINVLEWLRKKYSENIIYDTCENTKSKFEVVY